MPDRSKVMVQTKMNTLALQVGGWAWGLRHHPLKTLTVEKHLTIAEIVKESKVHHGLQHPKKKYSMM
jgi:hypothetical protein